MASAWPRGTMLLFALFTIGIEAQDSLPTLFASWDSTNKGDTQWVLEIKPPYAGTFSSDQGVKRTYVPHGWTSGNPTTLGSSYTDVEFLRFDNDSYTSSSNYNSPRDDAFAIPAIWSNPHNYAADSSLGTGAWLPAARDFFSLGPSANFTTSRVLNTSGTQGVQNTTWSSVPFGLSLGFLGHNGSVTFGGSYDWTRVNDTQWHQLPADLGQCLLHIGGLTNQGYNTTCSVDGQVAKIGNPPPGTHQNIDLDWNLEVVGLPDDHNQAGGSSCFSPINMTFAGARIDIYPSDLSFNNDTDTACATSGSSFGLGIPFFRSIYIYADHDGSVYIARALASNSTAQLRPFDPNEAIEQHPNAQYHAPKSGTGAALQTGIATVLSGPLLCILSFIYL